MSLYLKGFAKSVAEIWHFWLRGNKNLFANTKFKEFRNVKQLWYATSYSAHFCDNVTLMCDRQFRQSPFLWLFFLCNDSTYFWLHQSSSASSLHLQFNGTLVFVWESMGGFFHELQMLSSSSRTVPCFSLFFLLGHYISTSSLSVNCCFFGDTYASRFSSAYLGRNTALWSFPIYLRLQSQFTNDVSAFLTSFTRMRKFEAKLASTSLCDRSAVG